MREIAQSSLRGSARCCFEIMPLHRRVIALLTGLLLLQFTLVGRGFACTTDEIGGSPAMAAMDDMVAMGMGSPDLTQAQATDTFGTPEPTPEKPCGAPARSQDCGGSSSSEACTAMTSCASPPLGAVYTPIAQPAPSHHDAPRERVIPPPSRQTAPDHPPPRA